MESDSSFCETPPLVVFFISAFTSVSYQCHRHISHPCRTLESEFVVSCYSSESMLFIPSHRVQYTLRFETVELTNTWYHLLTPEPAPSAVEPEPEPTQNPIESVPEPSPPDSDNQPNETPYHQCPVTVEYLQQNFKSENERLHKTQPPCSIPPIPPPPPKRDHSTLKRRVELKNY